MNPGGVWSTGGTFLRAGERTFPCSLVKLTNKRSRCAILINAPGMSSRRRETEATPLLLLARAM